MKKGRVILLVVLGLVVLLGVAVFMALPRPVAVDDPTPDLAAMPDGQYTGTCDNGLVKATVRVTVAAGAITGIEVVEHQNAKGQPGEAVLDEVVAVQRLDVDAVAGATASSRTLLKAVENALQTAA